MIDKSLQNSVTWLQALIRGTIGHGLETRVLDGLVITEFRKGIMRSDLIVPSSASDADGNWHVGAIAAVIDTIGAIAVFTFTQRVITSLDFSVSYYSTAKIQEHVEIDAKVKEAKGSLTQVMVEVRRKGNGDLIAMGKLWMASNSLTVSQVSRL